MFRICFCRSFFFISSFVLYQADCLSPLHLAVLLGFYLVPSSGTYFAAVSFCLNFSVCGLFFAGCRVVISLASGVCPLVAEVGLETCAGFLLGGTSACQSTSGWSWVFPLCWAGLY